MAIQGVDISGLQRSLEMLGQSRALIAQREYEERLRKEQRQREESARKAAEKARQMQTIGMLAGAAIGGGVGGGFAGASLGAGIGQMAGGAAAGQTPEPTQLLGLGLQAGQMHQSQQAQEKTSAQNQALNNMIGSSAIQRVEQNPQFQGPAPQPPIQGPLLPNQPESVRGLTPQGMELMDNIQSTMQANPSPDMFSQALDFVLKQPEGKPPQMVGVVKDGMKGTAPLDLETGKPDMNRWFQSEVSRDTSAEKREERLAKLAEEKASAQKDEQAFLEVAQSLAGTTEIQPGGSSSEIQLDVIKEKAAEKLNKSPDSLKLSRATLKEYWKFRNDNKTETVMEGSADAYREFSEILGNTDLPKEEASIKMERLVARHKTVLNKEDIKSMVVTLDSSYRNPDNKTFSIHDYDDKAIRFFRDLDGKSSISRDAKLGDVKDLNQLTALFLSDTMRLKSTSIDKSPKEVREKAVEMLMEDYDNGKFDALPREKKKVEKQLQSNIPIASNSTAAGKISLSLRSMPPEIKQRIKTDNTNHLIQSFEKQLKETTNRDDLMALINKVDSLAEENPDLYDQVRILKVIGHARSKRL